MLENVNYSRDELLFLNMCRQGVIGEILHGEAAYIHELRERTRQAETTNNESGPAGQPSPTGMTAGTKRTLALAAMLLIIVAAFGGFYYYTESLTTSQFARRSPPHTVASYVERAPDPGTDWRRVLRITSPTTSTVRMRDACSTRNDSHSDWMFRIQDRA